MRMIENRQIPRTVLTCLMAASFAYVVSPAPAAQKEQALPDEFTVLRPGFSVAPQLSAADIAAAAKAGYTLIVNNRPDGEMFGQPESADLEAAAREAGIAYAHIPVDGRGISMGHISALKSALEDAGAKTVAFCRSGARSAVLQAYLAAAEGRDPDAIIAEAAGAGFDIRGQRPALEALKAAHQED